MQRILPGMVLIFCLVITAGCSNNAGTNQLWGQGNILPVRQVQVIMPNYTAGTALLNQLDGRHPEELAILLTSFVNLDDFGETSSLGRIIPQHIGTRLTQNGYQVVDIRLRNESLLVREYQGEFALSRKISEISEDKQAYSVLVGTYSVVYNQIFVNAKVLRSRDGLTLASTDFTLPFNPRALDPAGFSGADSGRGLFIPNVITSLE